MGVSIGIATRPWPSPRKQPLPSKEQLSERLTSLRRSREGNFSQLLQWLQSRKKIDIKHGEKGGRKGCRRFERSYLLEPFSGGQYLLGVARQNRCSVLPRSLKCLTHLAFKWAIDGYLCQHAGVEREGGRQTTESCKEGLLLADREGTRDQGARVACVI